MTNSSPITVDQRASSARSTVAVPDPLGADCPLDEVVAVTRRAMVRLALVACETGARFQREGIALDPMAWMLAPRRLFEGSTALDACIELDACRRAVLVHGLGLGLDADRHDVDYLLSDDEGDHDDEGEVRSGCAEVALADVPVVLPGRRERAAVAFDARLDA